jgi:hypothetical protein
VNAGHHDELNAEVPGAAALLCSFDAITAFRNITSPDGYWFGGANIL